MVESWVHHLAAGWVGLSGSSMVESMVVLTDSWTAAVKAAMLVPPSVVLWVSKKVEL